MPCRLRKAQTQEQLRDALATAQQAQAQVQSAQAQLQATQAQEADAEESIKSIPSQVAAAVDAAKPKTDKLYYKGWQSRSAASSTLPTNIGRAP
jgi:chromosome segregation ATPase